MLLKLTRYSALSLLVFFLYSCTPKYYMTTDILAQQLSPVGKDTTAPKPGQNIKNGGGLIFMLLGGHAYTNGLTRIACIQKKDGKEVVLTVNDQTVLRLTDKSDNTRARYYYDSMFIKDSCVYGIKSRLFRVKGKIPLSNISKVEVISPASDKLNTQ